MQIKQFKIQSLNFKLSSAEKEIRHLIAIGDSPIRSGALDAWECYRPSLLETVSIRECRLDTNRKFY